MIEQYKILAKATALLRDKPELNGVNIEQSVVLNGNPDVAPWIGVYPDIEVFEPAYIGGVDSWEREVTIRVYIQVANARDGETMEQTMSEYIKEIIAAVYANAAEWDGLIERFTQIRVEHGFQETDKGTMLFRESTVLFVGTTASGVQ